MGNSQPKIDPAEQAKQNKRAVSKAIRTIEREQKKLQQQEPKLLKEIKALAQKNQHGPAKIMSKDLVRTRNQINQYYTMISQMKGIQMQLAAAQNNATMVGALKGVNQVMANVNGEMDVSQITQVLKEFSKESAKMEMQGEMMNDQMEMAMDTGDTQEQADEVYAMILGEVGMNMNAEIKAGEGDIQQKNDAAKIDAGADDDLQSRLDALKGL